MKFSDAVMTLPLPSLILWIPTDKLLTARELLGEVAYDGLNGFEVGEAFGDLFIMYEGQIVGISFANYDSRYIQECKKYFDSLG